MWGILADAFLIPGCVACGELETLLYSGKHGLRLCEPCEQAWPKPLGNSPIQDLQRMSLWPYEGTVRRLLVQAKDMPYCAQAWALRKAASRALANYSIDPAVWCLAPPSRRRQFADWYLPGFVGETLARSQKCRMRSLLARRRQRRNQSTLSGAERRANLQGVFQGRGGKVPKEVVVFDDVSTTGATLTEAARALQEAGVHKVTAVCLAAVE